MIFRGTIINDCQRTNEAQIVFDRSDSCIKLSLFGCRATLIQAINMWPILQIKDWKEEEMQDYWN